MMRLAIGVLSACAVSAAVAAEERPPIESFFKLPQYAEMQLSPDGTHIAALAPLNKRQGLVVIDVKNRSARPIAGRPDRDIVAVSWINNKRILYYTGRLAERVFDQRGGGIFAVDIDGSNERLISEGSDEQSGAGRRRTVRPLAVVRTLPGETDDIIAEETILAVGALHPDPGPLYRVDTRTGRKTNISLGKPESGLSEGWVADRDGVARVFTVTAPDETRHIYYRAGPEVPWEIVRRAHRAASAGGPG